LLADKENQRRVGTLTAMPMSNKRYLDVNDLRALEEGFKAGRSPDEIKKAEEVLRDLGYEKKSKAHKRPGPKKKKSLNPTDETLRRLVATIRAVLGLPDGTSKIATLTVLFEVIAEANQLLRDHFFVTIIERQQLRSIFARAEQSEYEFLGDLRPLLQPCLDELGSDSATWDDTVRDLASREFLQLKLKLKKTFADEESGGQKVEAAIYLALASAFELDIPAWLEREHARNDGRLNDPISGHLTLEEMGLHREHVLVTAIGRLFHLESVFSTAQLLLSDDASKGIRNFLQDNNNPILNGSESLTRIMLELGDLFWRIGQRQGVHPRRLKLENLVLDRRPSTEGQISTGG
jgi:hypothetical protein